MESMQGAFIMADWHICAHVRQQPRNCQGVCTVLCLLVQDNQSTLCFRTMKFASTCHAPRLDGELEGSCIRLLVISAVSLSRTVFNMSGVQARATRSFLKAAATNVASVSSLSELQQAERLISMVRFHLRSGFVPGGFLQVATDLCAPWEGDMPLKNCCSCSGSSCSLQHLSTVQNVVQDSAFMVGPDL